MISFDLSRCVGCGSCVRVCPMGYLTLEEKVPQVRQHRRCIECGHCVATCPKQAVTLTVPGVTLSCPTPENPLEELLLRRRSVRHFRPDPPPRAVIQRALDPACLLYTSSLLHLYPGLYL